MARVPKPWYRADRGEYCVTLNGTRHRLGPDKAKAFRRFHELMARQPEPPPPASEPTALTVAHVFDRFLDWCQTHRAPRTYDWCRAHIQTFCDHLKAAATMPAADLRPFHVQRWVDGRTDWGPNHKRGAVVAVTRPFNWAAKQGYLTASPVRGVEKPPAVRRNSTLTPMGFEELMTHVADGPFRDLLTFAYEAGVRPQEARRLEARHVRAELHRAEIPPAEAKGKRRWRVVYLSDAAAAILARRAETHPTGPLFRNADGNPWTAQAVVCRFQRLLVKLAGPAAALPPLPRFDRRRFNDPEELAKAREAHLRKRVERRKKQASLARAQDRRVSLYDLRHLFATRKLKEGHDPITVATLLGHKDGTMLCKHYEHISDDGEHLRRAVNGG